MYNVSPPVLESLKATLALQSRMGDTILIFETFTGLEFAVENSSSTVLSRAFFSRHIFDNTIDRERAYCVPSSTFDRVLSSIPQAFSELTIEFREKVHIEVVYKKIHRSHQIDLLDSPEIPRGVLSLHGSNAFIIKIDMLREILTHFSPAAELVELYFDAGESIRWRGYRNPKRNGKTEIYTKIDSAATMHYSDMFVGVDAQAPWRAEFRLKELRLAVAFFERVCQDAAARKVNCIFDQSGAPLTLIYAGQLEVFSLRFETSTKHVLASPVHLSWNEVNNAVHLDLPYEAALVDPQTPERQSPPAKRQRHTRVPTRVPTSVLDGDGDEHEIDYSAALVDPQAEIEGTQQDRVPGLFD